MEKIKKMLPAILLILFEIAVGIILLINPERFTIAVFIIFGSVLILCSLVMLFRWLKERKAVEKAVEDARERARDSKKQSDQITADAVEPAKVSILPLIAAIVTFVLGAVFAFGAGVLYDWTALLVIFYGAIMVIKGIFKIADYASLRKEGVGVSPLRLVVGILSVALGVVMMVFFRDVRDAMFVFAAIALLVEAVLDIATLVLGRKISKQLEIEAKKAAAEKKKNEKYDLDNFAE